MESMEVAEFTTKWKMWWFLDGSPKDDKCLNCETVAELGFGHASEPTRPTRCRSCAKAIFQTLGDSNKSIGLKALADLP